jgi:hypothetical protein
MTAKEILQGYIEPKESEEIGEGEIPLEISTVLSILNTLKIPFESISEEQFLDCCETVYCLMIDMVEIGQFVDTEDDEPDLEEAEKPIVEE